MMKKNNILEFPDRKSQILKEKVHQDRLEQLRQRILEENPDFISRKDPFNTKKGISKGVVYMLGHRLYKMIVFAVLQTSNSVNTRYEFDAMSDADKIMSILYKERYEDDYLDDIRNNENVLPFRMMLLVLIKEARFKIAKKDKENQNT